MLGSRKLKDMEARIAKLEGECGKRLELINLQTGKIESLKQEHQLAEQNWELERQAKQERIDLLNSRLADLGFDVTEILDDIQWKRVNPHLSVECMKLSLGAEFSNRFQISSVEKYLSRLLPAKPTQKEARYIPLD